MKVQLDIDPKVWWGLATRADREGVTVADLIVQHLPAPPAKRGKVSEAEIELHAQGLTDTEIAVVTGSSRDSMKSLRLKAGLKVNRPKGQERR
ncbi:MAG: hypothetical protein GX862_09935 [Leucobacter sp.]|nr:hypothetical protein [Leucobacter sp.]